MFGCTISGAKESYLKFEASGEQYCIRKVTGWSLITVDFSISDDLFELETGDHIIHVLYLSKFTTN